MRLLYFFACLFAITAIGLGENSAKKSAFGPAQTEAINDLKTAVTKNGGSIEPVHTKDGIIVVVTTIDKTKVSAIQEAGDRYASASAKAGAPEEQDKIKIVTESVDGKTFTQQVEKTPDGVLIILSSSDANTVKWLQLSGCCSFCVCPAGTHTQCASCC